MKSDTGQPFVLHKGCNSSTCCSPAKLWRTLQQLVKTDDKKGLIEFFKDGRLEHIVRVALTSRITNDASLLPPSQQFKIIRLTSKEANSCFGKSFKDLNLLQLALLTSSESTVLTVLNQLRSNTSLSQLKSFVNHVWGQGNTTLHLAVFLKRQAVIKALLDLGCLATVKNVRGKTPGDCCFGDQAILDTLSNHKKPVKIAPVIVTPVPVAIEKIEVCSSPEETQTLVNLPSSEIKIEEKIIIPDDSPVLAASDFNQFLTLLKHVLHLPHNIPRDLIIDKKYLASLVQPNRCIPIIQHKKPPDILCYL